MTTELDWVDGRMDGMMYASKTWLKWLLSAVQKLLLLIHKLILADIWIGEKFLESMFT
jgi:hypothetical protein